MKLFKKHTKGTTRTFDETRKEDIRTWIICGVASILGMLLVIWIASLQFNLN